MPINLTPTPTPASGDYFSITDVQIRMGEFNESVAADPDNQGNVTSIAAHELDAVANGNGEINTILKRNRCATPATENLDFLRDRGTDIGVFRVYRIRSQQDKATLSSYRKAYEDAITEIEELLFNNRGGFTRTAGFADAPAAVPATVDADGRRVPSLISVPHWNGYCWGY